jgi:hypothetical protein
MLRKYIAELYYGGILRQIDNSRYIRADILRQVHYGRYITADILRQIYYGRDITADILRQIYYGIYIEISRQIYYGRYITAIILRQVYYSRYITADILRQIYYGRYITADMLRTTTKTAISRQISSDRSSRLLHPNLLVATHRPKDSSGLFYAVYVENRPIFGRSQGQTGGDARFQEGVDAHGRKESAHRAPGPGPPLYTRYS